MKTAAVVALVLAASCGVADQPSTTDARDVLSQTAVNLDKIQSGELKARMSSGRVDGPQGGFELEGPFSLEGNSDLPRARLTHTRFDGDEERSATLVSDGTEAYVEADGERTPVDPDDADGLAAIKESRPSGRLDVGSWIDGEVAIDGGGNVGGVETDKLSADLDVPAVIDGLIELARAFDGAQAEALEPLGETGADTLRRSVKEGRMEVWTGVDDRLLRKLFIRIELGTDREDISDELREQLNVEITFETEIDKLNEDVDVPT